MAKSLTVKLGGSYETDYQENIMDSYLKKIIAKFGKGKWTDDNSLDLKKVGKIKMDETTMKITGEEIIALVQKLFQIKEH